VAEETGLGKGVIAAALSIIPGLGHLYLERDGRAMYFLIPSMILVLLTYIWPLAVISLPAFPILAGFDAFSIGVRGFGILEALKWWDRGK